MKISNIVAFAVASATLLMSAGANATTLDFSYVSKGSQFIASWTQSSTPSPFNYATGFVTGIGVSDGTGTGGPFSSVVFKDFHYQSGGFVVSGVEDYGVQLFTGGEANPVFATGSYALNSGTLTVTAAPAAVPEPATWALMLAGFGGLGATLRSGRRRLRPLAE